jgi:hypothetical protein
MVKKLFKHEFKAYGLWILLLYAAMPITAIILKVVYFFTYQSNLIPEASSDAENIWIDMLTVSSLILYIGAVGIVFTLVFVLPLVRYYKNMLTSEGYLTLSIPVTPSAHILCKTLVAYIYQIGAVCSFALSILIIIIGEDAIELYEAFKGGFNDVFTQIFDEQPVVVLDIILLLITAVISPIASILHYYFCLSSGMLYGKHKLIGALITNIIINMISSVLTGIIQFVLMPVFIFGSEPVLFLTIISFGSLLGLIGISAIFFYATVYLFTHKVNL